MAIRLQEYIEQIPPQRIISRYQPIIAFGMDEDVFIHRHPVGWGKKVYGGCRGCEEKASWKGLVRANLKETKELRLRG